MQTPISQQQEFSLRSIILGLILAVVMGASNAYLGLKVGMTITASIPAAVLAIAILRGMLRTGTILESNLVQTAASCGSDMSAGIIFTLPALIIIGFWDHFDYQMVTMIGLAGGLLGILFMIPMRRVFICGKYKDLPYPEAHATVAVMRTGYQSEAQATNASKSLVFGAVSGGLLQCLVSFVGLFNSPLQVAGQFFGRIFYFGSELSPALVAIGFIIRLKVAFQVFMGAVIAWVICLPIFSYGLEFEGSALDAAMRIWSTKIRYVGVGAMMIGGLASIFSAREGLTHALKEIFGKKEKSDGPVVETDRDISPRIILFCSLLCVLSLSYVFFQVTQSATVTFITAVILVVLGFFFTSVANYIVAVVGSSNSPVSGMNIAAVLLTGPLLVIMGYSGVSGMVATLSVAAVICCVSSQAGDSCNELKMGSLIGASPFRQQIMCIAGMAASALFMAPVLQLLHENTPGGIGGRELAAPQAALLASLVRGIFGEGDALPWNLIVTGMGVGILIVIVDQILIATKSKIRLAVMTVAVGIYLPAPLTVPMLIGGLVSWFVSHSKNEEENEHRLRKGVLFSSGFIAGESLTGVGIALLVSLGISRLDLGLNPAMIFPLSCLGAFIMIAVFVWGTKARKNTL